MLLYIQYQVRFRHEITSHIFVTGLQLVFSSNNRVFGDLGLQSLVLIRAGKALSNSDSERALCIKEDYCFRHF